MTQRIVVVGAGYSGLAAAKLTAKWTGAEVTLVNASDRFVERVRMHQLAAGQRLREFPLEDLVEGTGIDVVIDRVTAIDTAGRTVRLQHRSVQYDVLIYALGSQADLDSTPGVAEHAYTVASEEQAKQLQARLAHSRTVAVAGGGLTGIEAAAELAETHPDLKVRLVTSGVLGGNLSEKARRHLRRTFQRLGVEVREHAEVREVTKDGLLLAGDEHLGADTVVWTAGFRVSQLARESGIAVDEHGRVIVDDHLRSVSHPEIHAVGDAAALRHPNGQELRMACATGLPSAQHLARVLAGKRQGPLRFRYYNQCISLGRRDGLIQFVRADDSPVEMVLTGRAAALYKEAVVRGTVIFERHPAVLTP